jgi:hypothetical protein
MILAYFCKKNRSIILTTKKRSVYYENHIIVILTILGRFRQEFLSEDFDPGQSAVAHCNSLPGWSGLSACPAPDGESISTRL